MTQVLCGGRGNGGGFRRSGRKITQREREEGEINDIKDFWGKTQENENHTRSLSVEHGTRGDNAVCSSPRRATV